MKENKGITLIALVITIIVLLILAGVSIAMLSGKNGILNQASKSAEYNSIGEVRDNIANTVNEYVSAYYEDTYAGGNYIAATGTADAATTPVEAINDALTACKTKYTDATKKITVNFTEASDSDGSVTISSEHYTQTGTVNKDSGAVKWGDNNKK